MNIKFIKNKKYYEKSKQAKDQLKGEWQMKK